MKEHYLYQQIGIIIFFSIVYDHIWIIDADIEIVKKRLISQRNINEKNYQNILNNQQLADQMISILDKDKIPYSVIVNNTKKNDLNKIIDKKISEII